MDNPPDTPVDSGDARRTVNSDTAAYGGAQGVQKVQVTVWVHALGTQGRQRDVYTSHDTLPHTQLAQGVAELIPGHLQNSSTLSKPGACQTYKENEAMENK